MRITILAAWAIAVAATFPAQAAEPLLVVVETDANAGVSADEARAAIAAEVETAVLGPGERATPAGSGTLIVKIGERSAWLAYQPAAAAPRQRQMDLPARHDERLETIAWTALNLVRDQVGEPGPADRDGKEQPASTPSPSPLEPPRPASAAAPTPPTAQPFSETPVVAKSLVTEAKPPSPWSVAVFGGPTLHVLAFVGDTWDPYRGGNEWEIEATRSMGDWAAGLALDLGEQDIPMAALAAFAGDGWQWRTLRLEGTIGAGLELTNRRTGVIREDSYDARLGGTVTTTSISTELRLRPYGRANATFAWRIGHTLDVMLRVALHVASDDSMYTYGAALLGLRLQLP